ncbi:uncharacterized protein LOC116925766 [Daphnia magna]|uniref:Protein quiver n=1 Tax=Daphnia magna TaxID=35525 RepID=A0ABQ9ZU86_9CRUS|nr:uncharacterized protein LOC116925766 [Daphnia magna]KAK4016490.1 hypothetical protein OUZ56_031446 [Daphnia magna]
MSLHFLLAIVLVTHCGVATGELLCYSCISQGGGDDTCVTNPAAVTANTPIVKCKYKFCTIRRLEYASEPGMIYSFLRGCEDEPLPNGENPGEDITVWAQSCNFADLCNVGDGLNEITPDSIGSGGWDNSNILIVPASASALKTEKFFFVFATLLVVFYSLPFCRL